MDEARQRRYLQAKPIALEALERPPAERAALVEAGCGGDAALRAEVQWLLEAADATCETPLPLPLIGDLPEDASGQLIAADGGSCRYRLLRPLGEGGMGVVYLAERIIAAAEGEAIHQQVALKFVQSGNLLAPAARRRFVEERRILGSLAHPGIAHLIDGGSTRDGRPFLAMEYVEGERIDQWCERRQLSLRQRVELFLKVCDAVRHAHERLVIHRDIKPANILVTLAGEPKLLDFGIARLLDQVGGVATVQTMTMQRALTLAYASPEQVRGEPLGTRADVWSLGVVLYQLVCGRLPFGEGELDSPLDVSNAIVTGRIVPPSRRVERGNARGAERRIPRDIDAIVMKALRRLPVERYGSVAELAADLRRFLDVRPVRAMRGHRWYRGALYLRRHRVGLVAGVVVAGMLLAFMVERERQLDRVRLERDKTQAIAGFMQELFENADPTHAGGSHVTVRQVLDRGAATLARRSDIDPQVRVQLMLSMARSYNQLSLGAPAVALMKQALHLQKDYRPGPLEAGRVYAQLGRGYSTLQDEPSAIPADDRAIALLSQARPRPVDEILRVRINQLYNHLAVLDIPLDEVHSQIRAILATLEATPSAHDRELHLQALAVLAMTQGAQGEDDRAMATAHRAVEEARQCYVADDTNQVYYRFVEALVSLRSRPAQALAGFHRALDDYDRMVGTPGPSLGALLAYFGGALAQMGRTGDAVAVLERAARIAGDYAQDSPDFYFGTLDSLAAQYLELGRDADAATLLSPHLDAMRARMASGSVWSVTNFADALNVQGAWQLHRGRPAAALRRFRQSRDLLGVRERQVAAPTYAAALAGIGESFLASGDSGQASIWLASLQGFNDRARLATPDPAALDAAILSSRIALARGDFRQAASLAATTAAQSDARWGSCSRRSRDLRGLETDARQRLGQPPVRFSCGTAPTVAMQ